VILAPLRGVTIAAFRAVFADAIREAGFSEAITPFIPANRGYDPLKDRELRATPVDGLKLTPQFIGKDPAALAECLKRVRDAGYGTADLNAGCPYPMVRNKGRGSGLLRTPDVLDRMLEAGSATLGDSRFSLKTRLGIDRTDELEKLLPVINRYPLRFVTVHARTARQMYEGECDWRKLGEIAAAVKAPLVANGDLPSVGAAEAARARLPGAAVADAMVGRAFIVSLADRPDIGELLRRYADYSAAELFGDRSVLGRLKELVAYWKDLPRWRSRWNLLKLARTVPEFVSAARV